MSLLMPAASAAVKTGGAATALPRRLSRGIAVAAAAAASTHSRAAAWRASSSLQLRWVHGRRQVGGVSQWQRQRHGGIRMLGTGSPAWREQQSMTLGAGAEQPSIAQHDFESVNRALKNDTAILIDVREPAELHATGTIPGALNIPLKSQPDAFLLPAEEFEDRYGYPKPAQERQGQQDRPIIFYCLAGVRALAAARLAAQAQGQQDGGYRGRIGVYAGSWEDWEARGGRVERWSEDK
ncbi:hypothetical protein KEM52_006461 [Ascosphaera acerosa]|nr:hypothetical protein KEM52_006461 [Ascosphaera acerosa]